MLHEEWMMTFTLRNGIREGRSHHLFYIRGYGGIGRRGGFRSRWETMQVQVLLAAEEWATAK